MKSHIGFRLLAKSVTLNDPERHALILRHFTEFGSFGANYVKVVEYRPMVSAIKM